MATGAIAQWYRAANLKVERLIVSVILLAMVELLLSTR